MSYFKTAFYLNTCKKVCLIGFMMLIALSTNCLASIAGMVVFVYKLTIPLVLKYIGMATRCNFDWYLRRTRGKPKSILRSIADFISLVIISSPFRPKLNP